MFWVISVYFNIRNTLPKFFPFLLGHPVYIYTHARAHTHIMTQNPELGLIQGDIVAKFSYRTKRGLVSMVIEVCSGTRKKLLHTKLKLKWLICSTNDYQVARRCFKCSRFNHRHQDCRGEETCPLYAGKHELKECTAAAAHYKCINCVTFNRYTKGEKISECH